MSKISEIHQAKNPDNVLHQSDGEYESLVIIGYDKDGNLDARASTNIDHAQILWLLESFKSNLLNGDYG